MRTTPWHTTIAAPGPPCHVRTMAQQHQHRQQAQQSPSIFPRHQQCELVFDVKSPQFASDEFRMFDFKVKQCPRTRAHDWTQCPFAHPGEKARRRDPRKFAYSAIPCPDYRKGTCKRGDACEFAHGVFECWLHPTRYRTQMCTDGAKCTRLVCFFAHRQEDLRQPVDLTVCGPAPNPVSHVAASKQPPTQQLQHAGPQQATSGADGGKGDVNDQLFSVALAHVLAMQQQQTNGGRQGVAEGPSHLAAQSPSMAALVRQAQDIQQHLVAHGHMLGGSAQALMPSHAAADAASRGFAQPPMQPPHPGIPTMHHAPEPMKVPMNAGGMAGSPNHNHHGAGPGGMPYYPLSPNSPIDLLRLNSGLGAFGAAPGPSSMGAMMGPSSVPMASEALRGMSLERKSSSGLNEAAAEFRSSRSSSVEEPEHTMGSPLSSGGGEAGPGVGALRSSIGGLGKCGSLENLLQSLPRTLSDVGLADAAAKLEAFSPGIVQ